MQRLQQQRNNQRNPNEGEENIHQMEEIIPPPEKRNGRSESFAQFRKRLDENLLIEQRNVLREQLSDLADDIDVSGGAVQSAQPALLTNEDLLETGVHNSESM